MLVYAKGGPAEYKIVYSGKTIRVIALDLNRDYGSILEEIDVLAERIKASAREVRT